MSKPDNRNVSDDVKQKTADAVKGIVELKATGDSVYPARPSREQVINAFSLTKDDGVDFAKALQRCRNWTLEVLGYEPVA